ncbi:hypothetical protein ACQPW1_05505 [Nocardia sp. CA-128927]|uniref:hypothetical protein n=1 Tax=Nocardia sp. CA-128927 TaxID=3239975 RepID=UPI003D96248D
MDDDGPHQRFAYTAPQFDFTSTLTYDESGFVIDYPGMPCACTDPRAAAPGEMADD